MINDLNEIIQAQSNEIFDLKLRLNKYEPDSNHQISTREEDSSLGQNNDETSENNQSDESITDPIMPTCESGTDSDQVNEETTNKVINFIIHIHV